jgi:hypothetical protein
MARPIVSRVLRAISNVLFVAFFVLSALLAGACPHPEANAAAYLGLSVLLIGLIIWTVIAQPPAGPRFIIYGLSFFSLGFGALILAKPGQCGMEGIAFEVYAFVLMPLGLLVGLAGAIYWISRAWRRQNRPVDR